MKRIKKRFIVLGAILLAIVVGVSAVLIMNRPLSKSEMNAAIQKELGKVVSRNNEITSAVLTIYSDKLGLDESYVTGMTGPGLSEPVTADYSFFTASVGKVFTSVVFGMMMEEGTIQYDDPITKYLDDTVLDGLFVYEGVDYRDQVTILQLLKHTSGVGDYFEDPVTKGDTMLTLVVDEKDRIWSPLELVAFTRDNQKAVARPGEEFHYSDTGYILLGLVAESVTGQEFHEILQDKIIAPLMMDDTYLMFKSAPENSPDHDILEVYLDGRDMSKENSMSIDWAGGGIVSTMSDLLIFSKALNTGRLVSMETLSLMTEFDNQYLKGVNYGIGLMEFDFGGFLFFLDGMPNIYGGVGTTSTFVMYDKVNDIHIIANFGALDFMDKSVPFLISVLMLVDRLEKQ